MPYLSRKSKFFILFFVMVFILTAVGHIIFPSEFPFKYLSNFLYSGIILAWVFTVRRRVTTGWIKEYLTMGGFVLILLFIIDIVRQVYLTGNSALNRMLMYLYYFPITMIPLISFLLALRTGKGEEYKSSKLEKFLIVLCFALQFFIMLNDFHMKVFNINEYNEFVQDYSYGPGYVLIIAWCVILALAGLAVLTIRCRTSSSKKLWWVPIMVAGLGYGPSIVYLINGGKMPEIYGKPIFSFQELYSFIFIGMWESCLRIGLIASNSDYDYMFKMTKMGAVIADTEGNIRYMADDAVVIMRKEVSQAAEGEVIIPDKNHRIKGKKISGGTMLWVEDHSVVNDLNDRLAEAVSTLSEENSLLEMENEIKSQKQSIETRTKLYDRISEKIRPQLNRINEIIKNIEDKKTDMSEGIKSCTVLGAYVKRISNLTILNEQFGTLKLEELRYAVRESLENLSGNGVDCMVSGNKTDIECRGELVLYAYDFFERAVEMAVPDVKTISCILSGDKGLRMDILMDTPTKIPELSMFDDKPKGTKVEILKEEEGIFLRFVEEVA
ncbi:MAG: hypothetical protein IKP88_02565 [Lachnospiraceae bacterium]|nr:hypothetical protein [Lachnospiraceae bacterium]